MLTLKVTRSTHKHGFKDGKENGQPPPPKEKWEVQMKDTEGKEEEEGGSRGRVERVK